MIGLPRLRARRLRALPSLTKRTWLRIAGAFAALLVLGAGWLWLRDSSLVSVERVAVTGANGPSAAQIRSALVGAARGMTTLDVDMAVLRSAVAPYPIVKDLRVSTKFPHGLQIVVVEEVPIASVSIGNQDVPVSADGTLLRGSVPGSSPLPQIAMAAAPAGARIRDREALQTLALLAAAPQVLLSKISQAATVSGQGLVAWLRSGPTIYFGDATQLSSKWTAASEVLADSGSAGASYIDVTDAQRPAAGVGADGQGGSNAAPTSTTPSAPAAATSSSVGGSIGG